MAIRWLLLTLTAALAISPNLPAATGRSKNQQPASYTIALPPKPDFSSLDWLMGDWAGPITQPGADPSAQGTVHLTLSYVLDKRYVQVREEISLPAGKHAPAASESWVGFLSPDPSGSGFTLRSFSSTGFITQYHVSVADNQVRFDPEGGANPPPGWLFRRVISRLGPSYFGETVEAAPPGGSFFQYYAAKLTQVIESPPSPPAPAASKPAGTP